MEKMLDPRGTHNELIRAAVVMREASLQSWNHLLLAMASYATVKNEEMLRASPEALLRAQGAAVGVRELVQILGDAQNSYDKIRATENVKRAQHEHRTTSSFSA
jgi:hypothetical protein